jgi:hypothetical protein
LTGSKKHRQIARKAVHKPPADNVTAIVQQLVNIAVNFTFGFALGAWK